MITTHPLRLHLTISDRKFLHDTSVFLGTCGFEVQTSTHIDLEGDQILNFPVDVWVYEHSNEEAADQPQGIASGNDSGSANILPTAASNGSGPWRIAVLPDHSQESVAAAIAHGADDVIVPPLTPAKVLVRARHAASILRVTRGLQRDLHGPRYIELPGKGAMLGRIQQLLDTRGQHQESVCLGLFSLGISSPVQFASRLVTGRDISLLGTYLQNNLPPDAQLFHIANHLFAVVIQSKVPEQALRWCETRSEEINRGALGTDGNALQNDVSVGFAWIHDHSDSAEDLLDMGISHLRAASSAGGGLVVSDQVHAELLSDQDVPNLFQGMTASDIARPLVATLSESETVEATSRIMRQYQLDVVAVSGKDGQVTGLVASDQLEGHSAESLIAELVDHTIPRLPHDAPFEQLVASLAAADSAWILVQRRGETIGLVYCDDLATMNSPVRIDPLYSPLANIGAG
jgi:CBS domain-containing protein